MKAIDLSENNGVFDLGILKQNGINDVILRLCWIGNKNNHTKDKLVDEYYRQAKQLNMNISFYVYSYCKTLESIKSGIMYIDNLLNELNIPKNTTIYLDLEDEQIDFLSRDSLTNQAEYFCSYYLLSGYKSGIYANKHWFTNKLIIERLLNYKIWLAEWGVQKPTANFRVDLWQFTDCYKINNKLFDCSEIITEYKPNTDEGEFEVKDYINGSTTEYVYQDVQCTKQIGYLHPREEAKCYGVVNNRALIVYKVDGTQNYKSGFCKWLGGIK